MILYMNSYRYSTGTCFVVWRRRIGNSNALTED